MYNRTQGAGAFGPSSCLWRLLRLGVMPMTCRVPSKHLNRGAIAIVTQAGHWTRVFFAVLRMSIVAIASRVTSQHSLREQILHNHPSYLLYVTSLLASVYVDGFLT